MAYICTACSRTLASSLKSLRLSHGRVVRAISSSSTSRATEAPFKPANSASSSVPKHQGQLDSRLPKRRLGLNALPLQHFLANTSTSSTALSAQHHDPPPYLLEKLASKSFYLEVYGCQMNVSIPTLLSVSFAISPCLIHWTDRVPIPTFSIASLSMLGTHRRPMLPTLTLFSSLPARSARTPSRKYGDALKSLLLSGRVAAKLAC
jgi:hypothetical protein